VRSPYTLLRRKTSKSKSPTYYLRFWSYETHSYSSTKSVQGMLDRLQLDPQQYPPTQKATARYVGEEWLRRGLHLINRKQEEKAKDYLGHFWNWETSEYIRGKLARDPTSIGKQYAQINASFLQRYVIPFLPDVNLTEISTASLEKIFTDIRSANTLSGRTLNHILQAVRIPFTEAERLGLIIQNPTKKIRSFSFQTTAKGILTTDEIKKLQQISWNDKRCFAAFCLGLTTGLRMGEVRGLRKECIYENSIVIEKSYSKVSGLKTTKTNKARTIPIPHALYLLLVDLIQESPTTSDWLFWSDAGPEKPTGERKIEKGFYKALEHIGIPDDPSPTPSPTSRQGRNISFHSLRHSCNAFLRGVLPDEKVRMVTGHQSVELTNYYDHLTDLDIKAIIQAQEERLLAIKDR
jgi:integrase